MAPDLADVLHLGHHTARVARVISGESDPNHLALPSFGL